MNPNNKSAMIRLLISLAEKSLGRSLAIQKQIDLCLEEKIYRRGISKDAIAKHLDQALALHQDLAEEIIQIREIRMALDLAIDLPGSMGVAWVSEHHRSTILGRMDSMISAREEILAKIHAVRRKHLSSISI